MPVRDDPWPAGTPCWADLSVPDPDAAVAFYRDVIGWEFTAPDPQFGGYRIGRAAGRDAVGAGPIMEPGQPAAWTMYLASDDAAGTEKSIVEHGGTVLAPTMALPGLGQMLVATDPGGVVFGVWQADGMIGLGVVDEPGSLVWTDARLDDVERGKRFYADVFGLTYEPLPGGGVDYVTFCAPGGRQEHPDGGIGGTDGPSSGAPPHWLVYFTVVDVDAAVRTAEAAGATVLAAAETTPFGRMATIRDPFGAVFAVHRG